MEVDSDIHSANIYSSESEESRLGEDDRGTGSLGTQEKLQAIADLLRQYRWTFKDFLRAWVQEVDRYGQVITLDHGALSTPQQRQKTLAAAIDLPVIQQVLDKPAILATLSAEFSSLIQTRYFGKFKATESIDSIDFTAAFQAVQESAPTWHRILMGLLQNQRSHWPSYSATPQPATLSKRLYMVTSIICHSHARKQSNYLPSVLDMYLLGSGVKRRVIESLSGLGICHSYIEVLWHGP
jgi:hypothetical protein